MNYFCCHCGANLDLGDVFQYFYKKYDNNYSKAMQAARSYGWSETNQLHFSRAILIVGKDNDKCPECNKMNPFSK